MSPLLRARDLWAAPPGAPEPVLRGLSLDLEAGEWLAVSGSNGGGKTTLALVLAGLWPVRRGEVEFEGVRVESRRAEIAVVLQDPATQLFSSSVRDELACTARNLRRPTDQIERDVLEWSARLGLDGDLARDPLSLSAGRQQLVLLAAALIARPRLLIADEPAVHLDPAARGRVLESIGAEVKRGLAVVWITQAESERAAAHRVMWIGGRGEPGPASPPAGRAAGEVAVRVTLGAWAGGEGHAVRIREPLVLDLPTHGVVVLTGPNGSGKSVLLSAVVGLGDLPQCTLDWRVARVPPPLIASQYPEQQIFEEKVEEELLFAAVSRGLTRAEALCRGKKSLQALGFDVFEFLGRRSWWLSGGERRMVSVVAALIAPANLLALDEPTAGLDPGRRAALGSLVLERAASGPVLIATQDLAWVAGLGGGAIELGSGEGFSLPNHSKKMD